MRRDTVTEPEQRENRCPECHWHPWTPLKHCPQCGWYES